MLSHASPWWHGGGIGSVHHAVTHSPLFLSRSSQLKIGSYLKLRCRPLLRVAGALATGHVGVCSTCQVCSKVVRVMGIFTTGTGTSSIHIYCHKEHEMRVTSYSNKTQSIKKRSLITTAAALCASALTAIPSTNAFAPQPSVMGAPSSSTQLAARNGVPIHEDSAESSRRDVLKSSLGGLFAGLTLATNIDVQPASASYSAYTNREKDWDERKKSGGMSSSNDYEST